MNTKKLKFKNLLKKNFYSIILFHGVIKKNNTKIRNYTNKHIEIRKFKLILNYLKKHGDPVSLNDFIENKKNKRKITGYPFCITFDDGFENNYKLAAPILNKSRIPSIFYVTTNLIIKNKMTWIDQIEYLLEKKNIVLKNFMKHDFNLNSKKNKINFLKFLRKNVKKNFKKYNTTKIVKKIYNSARCKLVDSSNHILDKKMDFSQLKELSKNPLFQIGGHCHNHVSMASLNNKNLNFEVNKCLSTLNERLNTKIIHFSYPEGSKTDYNKKVIRSLKKKGIICCPTAISGHNSNIRDLFELRRIMI